MAATKSKDLSTPSAKKKAPTTSGNLTLEQARAIVQAKSAPVAKKAQAPKSRRAAATRNTRTVVAAADATPASVAIERRKLNVRQREERRQRQRDYKATLVLLQSRGVKGLPSEPQVKAPRRRASGETAVARSGPLRVLAEGDSWFDYPVPFFGGGLVPRLETRLGVPILNMAKAGDESRYMLGVEQRQLIAKHLRDGCPDGTPWELMLFSGGGNDIVAQPLALWLNPFDGTMLPARLINESRYKSALALVAAAYEDLIAIRDQLSPKTHLAFHGYDFAIPDGRGICHIGPWLKPAFDLHGFPADHIVSSQVVREMLLQFAAMLKSLQKKHSGSVTFIETQDTLAPVASSWHNEMHPSKVGFNKIADVFHQQIKLIFPGRVLA